MNGITRRRVAVVTSIAPPDYGGGGLSAYKRASRLSRTGDLSFVITRSKAAGGKAHVYKDLRGLPHVPADRVLRVTPVRKKKDGGRRSIWEFLDLPALAATTFWQFWRRRREYEIAHCYTANWLSFFAICASRLLRKPTILELTLLGRDDPAAEMAGDILGIKKLAKRIQLRLASAVVCLSPALLHRCRDAGMPDEKLHLVPRPVDIDRFRPVQRDQLLADADALGLSGRWPLIAFVGGLMERKGADLLVPIFCRVVSEYPNAGLLIVGEINETPLVRHMQREIQRLGLSDAVRFVERTGRIERYMRQATVFLLPTRREGFANVIVEAMACGVPPVVRLIPGITDFIIENGRDGFVVPGDDPEPFARAILEMHGNEALRRRMATSGRETVRTRFRAEIIDCVYADLYAHLISSSGQAMNGTTSARSSQAARPQPEPARVPE